MSLILAKYIFTGPFPLREFKGIDIEGLYGIFYLKYPEKKVADYGVLYFGRTEEITEQPGFPNSHKKFECWVNRGKGLDNLYIGFCATPGVLPETKEAILSFLIHKYNTICNK